MFRLRPLTFIVCGIVLIAVTWTGFYFLSIAKTQAEIKSWSKYYEDLVAIASQREQKAAQERVKQALEIVQNAEIEWKTIAEKRTPSSGRISLTPHRWQSTVNVRQWHSQVEEDLTRWIRSTGVKLVTVTPQEVVDGARSLVELVYAGGGAHPQVVENTYMRDPLYWQDRYRMLRNIPPDRIRVPYPTDLANDLIEFYFNYPALKFPVCFWPIGTVTVEGTYEQIVNHVRRWSDIPGYIASVRGLAISGTGSRLQGTYDLFVIAFINTENVFGGDQQGGRIPDISPGGGSGTMDRPGGGPGAGPGGGPGTAGTQGTRAMQ